MSDLIDRQALLDECMNHYEVGNIEQNCTIDWICKTVRNAPTIDAVQVVRCKDCIHYNNPQKCIVAYVAEQKKVDRFVLFDNDFYCADGERKPQ